MPIQHCESVIGCRPSTTKMRTLGWLAAMVVLWGTSWPVTRQALDSVPPLWLATLRFATAGVCLLLWLSGGNSAYRFVRTGLLSLVLGFCK